MSIVVWGSLICGLSVGTSVVLSLISRVLLTGALHEDGFADFCDGFGGGCGRERILAIMKDSHIGTYGVLGLLLYYLLMWNVLCQLFSAGAHPLTLLVADVVCKGISSTIVYFLPYARREEEAKSRVVYLYPSKFEMVVTFILVAFALILSVSFSGSAIHVYASFPVVLVVFLLFRYMQSRIHGYTGDCCGASFLIAELIFYLSYLLYSLLSK